MPACAGLRKLEIIINVSGLGGRRVGSRVLTRGSFRTPASQAQMRLGVISMS